MEWMLLPASKFDITVSNKFPSANKYVAIHLGLFKFSESNNVVCVNPFHCVKMFRSQTNKPSVCCRRHRVESQFIYECWMHLPFNEHCADNFIKQLWVCCVSAFPPSHSMLHPDPLVFKHSKQCVKSIQLARISLRFGTKSLKCRNNVLCSDCDRVNNNGE